MAKLSVLYTVENDDTPTKTVFARGQRVADFLDFVRERKSNEDLCAVWKEGVPLPLEDMFEDWYEKGAVFQVVSEGVRPLPLVESRVDPPVDPPVEPPVPPPPRRDGYTIYTNLTENSFKNGDAIDLEDMCTVAQLKEKAEELVRNMEGAVLPEPHDLHVFLPGGLPFLNGTLGDWCAAAKNVSKHNIYVVVTRPLGAAVNRVVNELTDCSSDEMRLLLSPLCDSSPQGYAEMACLLGYIQHGGPQSETLLKQLARLTRFAPLVCSVYRIMEQEEITGLNVISITGVLHTLFKCISNTCPPDASVLDRTLQFATIVCQIEGGEFLKLHAADWNDETRETRGIEGYCKRTGQQRHFVIWLEDTTEPCIQGCPIVKLPDEAISQIFSKNPILKPVSPLTTRYLYSTAVMKGQRNAMLMIGHVPGNRNEIRYIDPTIGRPVTGNIEDLGREMGDHEIDDVREIESERTGQILEILFDASTSMNDNLAGRKLKADQPREEARIEYAKRFLSTFMSRTYAYRVASVFGLMAFNNEPKPLARLSPIVADFEDATRDIKLAPRSCLWDAIIEACKTIRDYNIREFDDKEPVIVHPNAAQRILVISDGEDEGSEKTALEAADYCIKNNVIVDSVLISTNEDNWDLAVLCDVTGGLAFQIETLEQGLELFEQEAFLNVGVRRRGQVFAGPLTEAVWTRKLRTFNYSQSAPNRSVYEAEHGHDITSPEYLVYLAQDSARRPDSQRLVRIVCEIKYILNHPNENLQIWVNSYAWYRWRVFIKGPEGTPYSGKWWSLYVTFPSQYPTCPPNIRFLSVPYHPNVSHEGRVIFSRIDDGYNSSLRVLDILTAVIDLLRNPELGDPIQARIAEAYRNRGEFDRTASRVTSEQAKTNIDDYPYMQGVTRQKDPPGSVDYDDDTIWTQLTMTRARHRGEILGQDDDTEDAYELAT